VTVFENLGRLKTKTIIAEGN